MSASMTASSPLRTQPRLPRILLLAVVGLAVTMLALIAWYAVARFKDASVSARLEAQARQKGEPVTLAELVRLYPPIPDAENAAMPLIDLWKRADPDLWNAFLEGKRPVPNASKVHYPADLPYLGSEARWPERGVPLPPASKQTALNFLQAQAGHLVAVREALRRPRGRFPFRIEAGHDALLPHLSPLRHEAQCFKLEALVAAEQGDVERSIDSLEQTVAIAHLLDNEPVLIGYLVQRSCLTMAVDVMEELLSRQALEPEHLQRLEQLCHRMNVHGSLRRALIGERVQSLSLFNVPPTMLAESNPAGTVKGKQEPITPQAYRHKKFFLACLSFEAADRRLLWEGMNEAIALADLEPPESLQRAERLDKIIEQETRRFPPRIICGMLLPSIFDATLQNARFEARRRAALVAIFVERHRLAHQGVLPEGLDKLVPEFLKAVPTDPFDGKPLRYLRRPTGYVVYSVGVNRQDDGGIEQPRQTDGSKQDYDETFIVER
jgi:hypothetical protein